MSGGRRAGLLLAVAPPSLGSGQDDASGLFLALSASIDAPSWWYLRGFPSDF
jgi:hypothetical protein